MDVPEGKEARLHWIEEAGKTVDRLDAELLAAKNERDARIFIVCRGLRSKGYGITDKEVATASGVSRARVSQILSGKNYK